MLSSQEEQEVRRRTMQNDARVREQGGTMHAFAVSDAATPRGRYSQVTTENVVGATALPNYPAGPAWCADPGSQLLEPPLGLDNPALDPSMSGVVEGSGGAPSASDVAAPP